MFLTEDNDAINNIQLSPSFWLEKVKLVISSLKHQWQQLENYKTIDNFRLVAGLKEGFREGFFYTDSDAFKWGEAACRCLSFEQEPEILHHLNSFIELVSRVQDEDGYIYTYNQYHFPGHRWENLLIEHELYCMGHFIEFALAHYNLTKKKELLNLAIKTANLIYTRFIDSPTAEIPGHEEIEIALIKLYRVTKENKYLELAKRFLEKRGRTKFFFYHLIKQNFHHSKKEKIVLKNKEKYYSARDSPIIPTLFQELETKGPPLLKLRGYISFLTGKYFQAHRPLRKLVKPVGHSVRWGYLVTAATMLYQETGDQRLLRTLQQAWDNMVKKRMYVTGGLGSLPFIEGFGRDYELNPRYAYCETCAAIASIYWNWEMFKSTKRPQYMDLLEWQLYNAMLVALSQDGKSFFYHNPLESEGLERKSWYLTACCPPNIARTIARITEYIYYKEKNEIWINLYISNVAKFDKNRNIIIDSSLPFENKVMLELERGFKYHLRIPSWSRKTVITTGTKDKTVKIDQYNYPMDPYQSRFITINDIDGKVELEFDLTPQIHFPHKKDKSKRGKVALSRGPILYCFESIDNPNLDFNETVLDLNEPLEFRNLTNYGKIPTIICKTITGEELTAVPYYFWGNRNDHRAKLNKMTVWIRAKQSFYPK